LAILRNATFDTQKCFFSAISTIESRVDKGEIEREPHEEDEEQEKKT